MANNKTLAFKVELQGTEAQKKKLAGLEKEVKELTLQRAKLNKTVKKSGVVTKKYGQEIAAINTKLKAHRRQLLVTRQEMLGIDGFTTRLGKSFRQMGSSIVAGFAGLFAVQQFFQVIKDGVRILEEFEQQMAKVKAVTGASEVEFKMLTESAKELGRASLFTSSEVGQLQEELAKLGFTTPQILQSSEAILQLATATGTELAQASEVAASTLNAFGLEAIEAQNIVDLMAESFSSTPLDINKFQESMKLVAPTARSIGQSVQETTAQLGLLAKSGISGSIAGTQLSRVFIELNKKGISLKDAMNQVANSSDKLGAATELVGDRGAKALQIFASQSEELATLTESFKDSTGEAAKMADIVGNTSVGATKKLSSAYEGMVLSIGDGTEDVLTKVKLFTAEILNSFTDVNNQINRLRAAGENSLGLGFGIISDEQEELLKLLETNDKFLANNINNAEKLKQKRIEVAQEIVNISDQISQAQKDDNEDLAKSLIVVGNIQAKFFNQIVEQQNEVKRNAEASKVASEAQADSINKTADSINNVKFSLEELEEVDDDFFDDSFEEQIQKSTNALDNMYNTLFENEEKAQQLKDEQATIDAENLVARSQKELDDEIAFKKELDRQKIALAEQTATALVEVAGRKAEREKTLELANLDAQLQQGLISQEEFEKQREAIERKAFQRQKRLEIAQIAISLASEIASIAANSAGNPLNAFTFGAAGAAQNLALAGIATARSAVQAGIIQSQKFADGGYTGDGFGSPDSSGFKQAGVVHEGEYVVPKNVLESQRGSSLVGALESMRTNKPQPFSNFGFANGGFAGGSSVDMVDLENKISKAVANSVGAIQVVNNATDTISQAARVNNIQSEATFG